MKSCIMALDRRRFATTFQVVELRGRSDRTPIRKRQKMAKKRGKSAKLNVIEQAIQMGGTVVVPAASETSAAALEELAAGYPLLDRMKEILITGPMTEKALAEELNTSIANIRATRGRHKSQFVKMGTKIGVASARDNATEF